MDGSFDDDYGDDEVDMNWWCLWTTRAQITYWIQHRDTVAFVLKKKVI